MCFKKRGFSAQSEASDANNFQQRYVLMALLRLLTAKVFYALDA
jgi:hypothetical protein